MELTRSFALFKKKVSFNYVFSFLYFSIGNISRLFSFVGIPREIVYGIFCILLIVYLMQHFREMNGIDWLLFALLFIIPITGVLINYDYISSLSHVLATIVLFVPAFFFFRTIKTNDLVGGFKIATIFNSFFLIFYYFISIRNTAWYDMSFGYWASFAVASLFFYAIKQKKMWYFILSIILFALIFIDGSRGAFLLTAIETVFIVFFSDIFGKKKILIVSFVLLITIIVYINFETILTFLSTATGDRYAIRNLYKLMSGDFLVSEAREQLYVICKSFITENPFGYGPLSSRKLIASYPYPHSIFYELQVDYGQVLGVIILGAIIAISVYMLFYYRKKELFCLLSIICVIGVGSLFFSSSLYIEYYIPALIGLFVKTLYETKRKSQMVHY